MIKVRQNLRKVATIALCLAGSAKMFAQKMTRKLFLLTAALMLTVVTFAQSGTCGANLNWEIKEGTLTINGTGAMYDYTGLGGSPWHAHIASFTKIVVGEGATSIGNNAFSSTSLTSNITSVSIPSTVTSIGTQSFFFCGLTSVTIPDGVSIGYAAFSRCQNLVALTFSGSCASIGVQAFEDCKSLMEVIIPEGITEIGDYAFRYCSSLSSISFPSTITFGEYFSRSKTINGCTSLTAINIASGNQNYSSEDGVLFNKDKTTLICYPYAKQGDYVIPNTVTDIYEYTPFEDCKNLTSISIPEGVFGFYYGIVMGCTSLTAINVASGNEQLSSENGVLFSKDKSKLICYPPGKQGAYVIPSTVTQINAGAFNGCAGLTSVTIPASVTKSYISASDYGIGATAFAYCTGLTSIVVLNPEPVGLQKAGLYGYAFDGLTLSEITLYVPIGSGDKYGATDVWKEFNIVEGNVGINIIPKDTENAVVTGYYDMLGRKLPEEPRQGLYIIHYSNGTSKKVMR